MKQLMMGFAACALLLTGCTEQDITERVIDGQGQLIFSTGIGKQATKTAELTNDALQKAATKAELGIALRTYKETEGTPGTFEKWFTDDLWYTNNEWRIESTRFRNTVPTKFITYFPKTDKLAEVPSASAFASADFVTTFPAFTYTVADNSSAQEDLIAGITDIVANQTDITIGLRHILSQVNFGTRAYSGANIAIRNIQILNVFNSATYTYGTENKYPLGEWGSLGTDGATEHTKTYEYYHYDNTREAVTNLPVNTHTVVGHSATSGVYVFGDGGKWGPGRSDAVFYPDKATGKWANYNTSQPQASIDNSLMLMPQDFINDAINAKVTFEYQITDKDGAFVAGGPGDTWAKGEFKLDFKTEQTADPDKPYKDYLGKWDQNFRYLYLIDFTDFLDGSALTFTVDVEAYPWENYNNDGGDDGIINIMAAGQPTPANMNKIEKDGTWYIASQSETNPTTVDPQLWAQVIRDETWNLSTYNFTQIEKDQTIVLSFLNVIFNTKDPSSTATAIDLTLPKGYTATSALDADITVEKNTPPRYTIKDGKRSATAIITITNTNDEYSSETTLGAAIGKVNTSNVELIYKGTSAVDLTKMQPALITDNDKITVKFNSNIIPTIGTTTNGIWTWNATKKIATWTKWNTTLDGVKALIAGTTTNATTIYCSFTTEITSLTTAFGEPTTIDNVSTIKVVFKDAATRTGAATTNGVWTYNAASKTATWTKK